MHRICKMMTVYQVRARSFNPRDNCTMICTATGENCRSLKKPSRDITAFGMTNSMGSAFHNGLFMYGKSLPRIPCFWSLPCALPLIKIGIDALKQWTVQF